MARSVLDSAFVDSTNQEFNVDNNYNKPVIGIDRDGVLNVDLGTYVTSPEYFQPIPNSLEAVALLRSKGHRIAVITNQGGIEKGLMTPSDVDQVHNKMLEMLGQAGCPSIDAIYYSASSRKNDMYAKPNIGMFKRCEKEHPYIKFSKGFFVGDKLSDLKAAHKMGARPILVRTGHGLETEKQLNKHAYKQIKKQTLVFDNLWEFAQAL
jgi:D-glycero-D-manno-heptose 1,7-bisphosphate phosphatase|tara:strand:+ start:2151 stop:2774 length:624 start_codon:yes stop_codon:yes gene_type:complete